MTNLNTVSGQLAGVFTNFFSRRSVNASAREEEFSRRKPKRLDGFSFLVAMTLGRFKKSAQ